mmetsp:Transcript_457/g.835  ORF Transcript_457/g.835 Transcript_457/m.835 type:complete len:124 (+) Transcript_457:1751-2122(+)
MWLCQAYRAFFSLFPPPSLVWLWRREAEGKVGLLTDWLNLPCCHGQNFTYSLSLVLAWLMQNDASRMHINDSPRSPFPFSLLTLAIIEHDSKADIRLIIKYNMPMQRKCDCPSVFVALPCLSF